MTHSIMQERSNRKEAMLIFPVSSNQGGLRHVVVQSQMEHLRAGACTAYSLVCLLPWAVVKKKEGELTDLSRHAKDRNPRFPMTGIKNIFLKKI
jgi:hypothetical protein